MVRPEGFSAIILLVMTFVVIIAGGGSYLLLKTSNQISPATSPVPSIPFIPTTAPSLTVYSDPDFSFSYPSNVTAQKDTEADYSVRNNGDARKNFAGYVKYSPPEVLSAVSVLVTDSAYDSSPFTVWVFDNTNDLSLDSFFNKYWYYPFLWGQFNPPEKKPLALKNDATVSGQVIKYGKVDYQTGAPRYYYLKTTDKKMVLIRVLSSEGNIGEQILATFKLN